MLNDTQSNYLSYLTKRKKKISETLDSFAADRDNWIKKTNYYHKYNQNYWQFLIPKGKKVLEIGCGTGQLLHALDTKRGVGVDISSKMIEVASSKYPDLEFIVGDMENLSKLDSLTGTFDFIIMPDSIGYLDDCQTTFAGLHRFCNADTRIIISYTNWLWWPILKLAEQLGLKMPTQELNKMNSDDIIGLLHLAEFDIIKKDWLQLIPISLFGISNIINRYIGTLPIIRGLCLSHFVVARSLQAIKQETLSATVLVPCRNEKDNVENAIIRTPKFCDDIEFVFVEGHSSDGTFDECLRVQKEYPDHDIKVFQQPGSGKGDAVRKGFAEARGDVLMILDGDLTMPPEDLPKFYDALASGKGEFINGSRLIYPMENKAMRFLNYIANNIFSMLFSWLLNQRFTDTLCGTKVLRKKHYQRIADGRSYFGDFDPFGDFDLIFGATKQNLKLIEIPIRYSSRVYGETQISRFSHGFLLIRMVIFAYRKLKTSLN
ncbi:MAG: glycosyltransferase [Magnetococcales bacterium]|nr:glycosyltransferase [Magnetococcales bacterium]